MDDKVVIGHTLMEDFNHLKLNEEEYKCQYRDVSCFSLFQKMTPESGKRKLRELAQEFLNAKVQVGHHSSIIDARVALALYRTFQMDIESEHQMSVNFKHFAVPEQP